MHARADAIVAAVRRCVGTPFRMQGRLPGTGLDCLGVVAEAARAAGGELRLPAYTLDGDHAALTRSWPTALGCVAVDKAEAGDVLVTAPSRHRRHFAVVTPAGVVHAHAGIGRVVEGPLDRDWSVLAAWRLPLGD